MVRQSCASVLMALLCLLFCACGVAYDRYMQEGKKFQKQHETERARQTFHMAVLEARKDEKKRELLIDALVAEKTALLNCIKITAL